MSLLKKFDYSRTVIIKSLNGAKFQCNRENQRRKSQLRDFNETNYAIELCLSHIVKLL